MKYLDLKLIKLTGLYGIFTLVLATLSYNFLDIEIANLIQTSDFFGAEISSVATIFSKIFSTKTWAIVAILATMFCIFNHIKLKKPSTKIYTLALSLILAIIIASTVKTILARYRPEMLILDNKYGFHFFSLKKLFNSMPSGHTTLSFAGLLAIANFFNKRYVAAIAILIASLVAISRVIVLDHYVSDVLVATYVGIFSYLWAKTFVEAQVTKN
ncbi:phosphatase PAP2 family protein [Allofrancisella guangzhouensis]|uniref:undecaprenyl-diphosphate phosphatase n=1 Tax=Allofrancisella guangzhouensis TaxID=594679 RepID=A0A0A8E2K5_9GAMM|nr:phosphatase PAP2 family protein [Allofrancisella guangzhouensis]AJC48218.1 phosphoesterase [Allofrancisella guangzhouensis]MBK2027162.1 phosphatase PAP2 family protein [Allofrancisella guangzhouensis]MBK2044586.1 phosphatase PAP2 family protein [Allofrancisella guangzhouensis]MBK2045996.1 phosphatase PAP2 family protein [Allofrancisella guangzhouensis]